MARTRQTRRRPATRETVLETFTDNFGRPARRWRLRQIPAQRQTRAAALGYINQPIYAFQIYLSLDLGIQDEQDDAELEHHMDPSIPLRRRTSPTMKLVDHLLNVWEWGGAQPCWEFYTIPGGNVLDFIDHSRREIMHRHRLREAGHTDIPCVPRAASKETHYGRENRHGFLIAIDNDRGWHTEASSIQPPDRLDAPLWVRFDTRPSAGATTIYNSMRHWHESDELMEPEQWMTEYPDQLEVEIRRNVSQKLLNSFHSLLACSQPDCHEEPRHTWRNPTVGEEELEDYDFILSTCQDIETSVSSFRLASLPQLAPALDSTIHNDQHCCIKSSALADEPDIRYVVYISFLARFTDVGLQQVARRFALALADELGSAFTMHLDFYVPEKPTDAAVLAHYRGLGLTSSTVGVWTDKRSPYTTHPTAISFRELRPMSRDPRIFCNEPGNTFTFPVTAFVVVIDRPDFDNAPAVRFLITYDDSLDNAQSRQVSLTTWRPINMAGVVDRLAFRTAMEHVPDRFGRA